MKQGCSDVSRLSDAALEIADDILRDAIDKAARGWSMIPWCLLVLFSYPYALEVQEREQKAEYDFWLTEALILAPCGEEPEMRYS